MTGSADDQRATHEHHVDVSEDGHRLATADVTTSAEAHGVTLASFHAEAGHLPPGTRRNLVDVVMDLPDVRASDHLRASVPTGDTESIDRLRERTTGLRTHVAGCTALIDADISDVCECPRAGLVK
jgi:hypothetical protein